MAIVIHKPNDPVTSFTLTQITGSLPADTYKIRLEVQGSESPGYQAQQAQQRSAPSSEETMILTSSAGIQMN